MDLMKETIKYLKERQGLAISIIVLVILLIGYIVGIGYYQSRFVPRTAIGATEISGLTAERAQEKIQRDFEDQVILFTENDEPIANIQMNQLGVSSDFDELLDEILIDQIPFKWPVYLFKPLEIGDAIEQHVSLDYQAIESLYAGLEIDNEQRTEAKDAYLSTNEAGYYEIQVEQAGTEITPDSLEQALYNHLSRKSRQALDLSDAYLPPDVTAEDEELNVMEQSAQKLQKVRVTLFVDGEDITIPPEEIAGWIEFDDHGEAFLEESAVNEYVEYLNKAYSTRLAKRQFESTLNGLVTLQPGTLGWYLNIDEETQNIMHLIYSGEDISYDPDIYGFGYGQEDDIGDSYVEVDLVNQMMWIYIDGEQVFDTPIVSGQLGAPTIPGAYQVWNKESPSVLVDYNPITEEDYEVPVQYWIAFDDQAQGLHDAEWQQYFGGDAYLEEGSLGCINISPSVMKEVYDLVDHGMPVLIFDNQ